MHLCVIHVGAPNETGEEKFLPCRGSNRGSLRCEANTLPRRYKSWIVPQGSTRVLYSIHIPCDTRKLLRSLIPR